MTDDRLRAILASPSYRLATEDDDFLESDGARAIRLALEFHRADTYLHAYGIESTVVSSAAPGYRHPRRAPTITPSPAGTRKRDGSPMT